MSRRLYLAETGDAPIKALFRALVIASEPGTLLRTRGPTSGPRVWLPDRIGCWTPLHFLTPSVHLMAAAAQEPRPDDSLNRSHHRDLKLFGPRQYRVRSLVPSREFSSPRIEKP